MNASPATNRAVPAADAGDPALRALCAAHGGRLFLQHGQDLPRPFHPPRTYWLIFEHPLHDGIKFIRNAARISGSWGMIPRLKANPRYRRTIHSLSFTYILRGHGHFRDQSGKKRVKAGDLLTLFPENPHVYGPIPGERWGEISVFFGGPIFESWQGNGLLDEKQPVRHLFPVEYWIERMHETFLPMSHRREQTPQDWGRLAELVGEMAAAWQAPASDPEADWLKSVRHDLHASLYDAEFDSEKLARGMGLSERNFRRKFKDLSGITPSRFRALCRIDDACRLLLESEAKAAAIARAIGFANEYHFARRFKQLTGITPGAYRESHRNR